MDCKEDLTAIELENLALKNLEMGQFETALGFAQKAVEKDSSRFPSLACVCKCALALGRPRLAEDASIRAGRLARGAPEAEQLEQLVTLDQDYEGACLVKDYACVVACMDQLLEAVPCARYRTCKAEALAVLGRFEQAEEIASDELQGEADMADGLYIHALCLYYQEFYTEAFSFFQHALRQNPNHAKAKSIYERAVRLSAAKEAGNAAYSARQYADAHRLYTVALAVHPENRSTCAKLYFNRALAAAKLGRAEDAAGDCTAALALDPAYLKALLHRALCRTELGGHAEAARDYERALTLDDSPAIREQLATSQAALYASARGQRSRDSTAAGDAAFRMGDFSLARRCYTEALDGCPTSARPHLLFRRATATAQVGAHGPAVEDFTEALALDPTLEDALVHRAQSYTTMELLELALQDYQRLAEINNSKENKRLLSNAKRRLTVHKKNKDIKGHQNARLAAQRKMEDMLKERERLANERSFQQAREGETFDFKNFATFTTDKPLAGTVKRAKKMAKAAAAKAAAAKAAAAKATAAAAAAKEAYETAAELARENLLKDMAAERARVAAARHVRETAAGRAEAAKEAGNASFAAGRFAEAQMLYTRAMTLDPSNHALNAKLHFNRAAVHTRQGRLREAINDCTQALRLDKTHLRALLRRGKCYELLRLYEAAVRDYETAVQMDGCRANHRLLADARNAARLQKTKANEPPKAPLKPQPKVNLFYEVLGVSKNATIHEIKSAYRRKAHETHPDKHPHATASEKDEHERRFKEVGQAYSVLGDPYKRARYNRGERF